MLPLLAILALCVFMLTACSSGGGGSSPSHPSASTPAKPPTASSTGSAQSSPAATSIALPAARAIDFGYFGIGDGQIAVTAAHCSYVFCRDDGDWSIPAYPAFRTGQIIAELTEARARGVTRAIVSTGFATFSTKYAYLGTPGLLTLKAKLDAAGLTPMVVALYPLDEPDVYGVPDAVMTRAVQESRAAWPVPHAVIYGTKGGTPGLSAFDWIGRDDYGAGTRVLNELPSIRADQRWLLVPGGANPWKQDPQPYVDFARRDARVQAIVAFLYAPYGGGQGIGTNGMLPKYAAAGLALTGKIA